jgi:glycosyltransferase involved in cell wall biosynthesis
MTSRPRVLFIGAFPPRDSPIRGGIVTSCRRLLESPFRGWFDLILLDSTQRSIPEPGPLTRAFHAAVRVARFVVLLERRRPQAVLAFTSQGASFVEKSLCAAYARARGTPTVLLMRGGPFMDDVRASSTYRWFARMLLANAAVIPCQGELWRRFFRDELGISEARLPVIHNWTAPANYLAIPRDGSREDGPLRIVFLAWIDRAKGVFDLLDAVRTLADDGTVPAFELHLAGGGADIREFSARVAAFGLAERVRMHGWVGDEARQALFASADIFVLPSYAEGMPNSMIEAMSLAVPVVVSPVGSIPDVIRDGENGLLVPPGDAEALRATLARLLESPGRRRRIGEAGRSTARETFGLDRGAEALRDVLVKVMGDECSRTADSLNQGHAG